MFNANFRTKVLVPVIFVMVALVAVTVTVWVELMSAGAE